MTQANGVQAAADDAIARAGRNTRADGLHEAPGRANAVPPSPLPMAANLAQFEAPDGSIGVVMEISTPGGIAVYFLSSDGAKGLGDQLVALSEAGRAGIVLPGS